MPQLTVELETVTPLFLGGAEPRGSPPELRVASLRGALRYWLRALLGGVGDGNLSTLKAAENKVFGSTESGASPIIFMLKHNSLNTKEFRKRRAIREDGQFKPEGADYLFWSMAETGRRERDNWQSARQYIMPGTKFTVTMKPRLGAAPHASNAWWRAGAALWLLAQLGALGSRSRRGAGSICVADEPEQLDLPPFKPPATTRALQSQLKDGLGQIRKSIVTTGKPRTPPRFDVLAPGTCRIWVLGDRQPWSTWQQALDSIGGRMRDFRNRRRPDYDTMRDWMRHGATPTTVERAAFGLPLPFRYSRRGPFDVVQGSQHDRRSSPLWLRVTKLTNGRYIGVATLFKSVFLAERESLQLQRARRTTAPPADYSLIEQFIAGFPVHMEVKL